jgi:5-deoxy-D-glucuronate isomerase
MALTQTTRVFLGIEDDGTIRYRRTKVVMEDGELAGERIHSEVLTPGQDVTSYPPKVRAHCAVAWTPAVIAAYQAAHPPVGTP